MIPASVAIAATTPLISIPVDTAVRGDAGSKHELKNIEVSTDNVGMVCEVNTTAENQSSVHPGNDLVVASGDDNVTLKDVEREANGITSAQGQLLLGNRLTVTLVLGEDKVFSGGMNVELNCEKPPVEIKVCRDGKVVTLLKTEVKETDKKAPCPEVLGKKTLPDTGASDVLAIVTATAVVGTVAHAVFTKKRLS